MNLLLSVTAGAALALCYLFPFLFGGAIYLVIRRRHHGWSTALSTSALDLLCAVSAIGATCLVATPVGGQLHDLDLQFGSEIVPAFTLSSHWRFDFCQAIGNVALLFPLGAILPLRSKRMRSLKVIGLGALIVSLLAETCQYFVLAGRVASIDDVVLNVSGAVLGALATMPLRTATIVVLPRIERGTRRAVAEAIRCGVSAECGALSGYCADRLRTRRIPTAERFTPIHCVQAESVPRTTADRAMATR